MSRAKAEKRSVVEGLLAEKGLELVRCDEKLQIDAQSGPWMSGFQVGRPGDWRHYKTLREVVDDLSDL